MNGPSGSAWDIPEYVAIGQNRRLDLVPEPSGGLSRESAALELRSGVRRLIRFVQWACRAKPRRQLMPSFRLCYRLPDFRTAIGALIDEVDLRHAPMRLDVSNVHRE
jgi:hypothetical protein